MKPLKYAIIGAGANVLVMHLPALAQDFVQVVAISDRNQERGAATAEAYGCAYYEDYHRLLAESGADIAVILTTHPAHMQIALDCFAAGLHVLVEKPMADHIKAADSMIAAAKQANRQLGVCFQRRYMPSVRAAKRLIYEGQLGEIQYVYQSVLWTRPHLYFSERSWRGTWQGEGGGVLINQAAHNLDMLCFLVGLPRKVRAQVRTQLHSIETEDTAHAMLQWDNSADGFFHVSTAETGSPNMLEIRGTKGYLVFTDYDLVHYQLDTALQTYMQTATDPYQQPAGAIASVALDDSTGDHIAVYLDFHQSILSNTPSLVNGQSSRMSLELANAILYAAHHNIEVELPLDPADYADFLAARQK